MWKEETRVGREGRYVEVYGRDCRMVAYMERGKRGRKLEWYGSG